MHNITNKNSSAKTVAGENTTENFNEQTEVAQVSNSNESIAMNTANSQSSMAPQVGANETALGSRAEDTTVESVNELASCHVLIQVNVYGTKVAEADELTNRSIIVNFNPTQE